eukprot:Skav236738  [mRNA]  locus=scaffold3352:265623:269609:+ [translate_table: standard]
MTDDVVAFGKAISSCSKRAQWQQALELLAHLDAAKLRRNVVQAAAISACGQTARWKEALALLILWNSLISALAAAAQWLRSLAALEHLELEPDVVTLGATLRALERGAARRGGQWKKALQLFEDMSYTQLQRNIVIYVTTMTACSKADAWVLCTMPLRWQQEATGMASSVAAVSSCQLDGACHAAV